MQPQRFRMIAATALLLTILTATSSQAQDSNRVYYFVDAFKVDTTGLKQEKLYMYSSPVGSVLEKDLDQEKILADFRQRVKLKYGVSEFSSIVLRMNDSYEEANTLMKNYLDKFSRKKYLVVQVDLL